MTLPCTVCQAPVPVWDYKSHLSACVKIKMAWTQLVRTAPDPALANIAAADQAQAHLRESTGSDTLLPRDPAKTDDTPLGRWTGWAKRQGASHVPDSRTRCAHCNGLTHMYPNCSNCDGTGWV